MAFPTGWTLLAKFNVDKDKVMASSVDDVPVLLRDTNFHADVYSNVDDGGGDLRFSSDLAGASQLPCEILDFDTVNSEAVVWVKTNLSNATSTPIYIWGNNTGQSQPAVDEAFGSRAVWPSFIPGVYHLHDSINNSASATGSATIVSAPTFVDAKTGRGLSFDGTDDSVVIFSTFGMALASSSMYCWANLDSTSEAGAFMKFGDYNNGYNFGVGNGTYNNNGPAGNEAIVLIESVAWWDTNVTLGTGDFLYHIDVKADTSTNLYKNSQIIATRGATAYRSVASEYCYIGGYDPTGVNKRFVDAVISEAWFVKGNLATTYSGTLYNNQATTSLFGTAETLYSGDTPVTPQPRGCLTCFTKLWGI